MVDVLTQKELEALRIIRNYLMHNNRFPSFEELREELGYASKRSSSVIMEQLIKKKKVMKKTEGGYQLLAVTQHDEMRAETVSVPLLGTIACGLPIFASQNIDAMIPVSVSLAKPPYKYFLLRAIGTSMNEAGINDGDLVLVKQESTAENGDIVVALIDDGATIKQFYRNGDSVVLKPKTTDTEKHKPIILTADFRIQGKVVTTIPKFD